MKECKFCNFQNDERGSIIFENSHCFCVEQKDAVMMGWCMIIPKSHRETVFDLTEDEWIATMDMLKKTKKYLDKKYVPDGFNVGWNCGEIGGQEVMHAHLHIFARFADEPFARRGIRFWLKQPENKRLHSSKV